MALQDIEKILVMARAPDAHTLQLCRQIAASLDGRYSLSLMCDRKHAGSSPSIDSSTPIHWFDSREFNWGGFATIGRAMVPGHTHFPLLRYFREHPGYRAYWLVEDDVRFSGRWSCVFDTFRERHAGFVTAHIRDRREEPHWHWWSSLAPPPGSPPVRELRSFNTVFRLTPAALDCLLHAHASGWSGHHEALIPTILHGAGIQMLDMTGHGAFADPQLPVLCTSSTRSTSGTLDCEGSMRHRPGVRFMFRRNRLYHPVKARPEGLRDWLRAHIRHRLRGFTESLARVLGGSGAGRPRSAARPGH